MEAFETITARGHRNVLATNNATFEITGESSLTRRGDCIVAVEADKSFDDLSSQFQKLLRRPGADLRIAFHADDQQDIVQAKGCVDLILSHPYGIVVRKSTYVCGKTLAIMADKAASDLSRSLIAKLKNPQLEVKIALHVKAQSGKRIIKT